MARLRVAIFGATGETGQVVIKALIALSDQFELIALVRPASIEKRSVTKMKEIGVKIVPLDLNRPEADAVDILRGVDVVISLVLPHVIPEQVALGTAAKEAGVKRFVPSFFGPVLPARGVHDIREMREQVLDHVKQLYLPYTVIDIGWWYQLSLPAVPSGKIDNQLSVKIESMAGDGNAPIAMSDVNDVGLYVSKIIADPRTLNKLVFAYGDVVTQNQIWDILETESGETIPRRNTSGQELMAKVGDARAKMARGSTDFMTQIQLYGSQYQLSWGVRGDNTPEHAKYLGYLDARELYPNLAPTKFEDYVRAVVAGKARKIYQNNEDWQA